VRILFIIIALVMILAGAACATPSFVTYRALDGDGYISGQGRMTTGSAAFVTRTAQFKEITEKEVEENRVGGDTVLKIRAERVDGGDVAVGIAPAADLDAYLVRGSGETVNDLDFDPFGYRGVVVGGARPLPPPDPALFVAFASGPGEQEVRWTVQSGEWRAVIMNADGSAGVDVEARFGARFPFLRGFAIAGMAIGGTIIVLGLLLLAFQFRPGRNKGRSEPVAEEPA
jgi:hypothetical protein